ncbi:BRCT domain-containing protein [Stenotrophomonas sp. NLF4-10]|uniref:BRCT domain-containing protein n=1 Tax=Stenotrophomonas sp. NLF4-10 TaxID=2918754 RepID=UPI001EFB42D0|nr:BRCT domain-containing protein [Stenotrophomonas sp. NLF4-10]MCG8275379.1 BRCT domain-containing protein [Stenotrophomonas sp. NLF4-10]
MISSNDRAPSGRITESRRQDRSTNELVGICRGLLADGHVSQMEAEFLKDWIERNAAFVGEYPFAPIYRLLSEILQDGVIDSDESADLHDTLIRFVGGETFDQRAETASLSTSLPITEPQPRIEHSGAIFVVTGTFAYGPRSRVQAEIEQRGGAIGASPSKKTGYLVIGELGSRDWINSNAGTKIIKAVELRGAGHPIAIVSEQHWTAHLT